MKQTDQYKLNQWDPTDRILREDFNADNLKIAAALAGKLGRTEFISQQIVNGTPGGFDGGLDIDWNDWECVFILFDLRQASLAPDDALRLWFNGSPDEYFQVPTDGAALIIFLPWHDSSRGLQAVCLGKSASVVLYDKPFSDCHGFMLNLRGTSNTHFVNPRLTVYGIR